jgi:hypothetical protein
MAITVTFEFRDSIEKYDRALRLVPEVRDQPGRRCHVCCPVDDGFVVIEVWESADAFEHFLRLFGPLMAEVGLACEPRVATVHHAM